MAEEPNQELSMDDILSSIRSILMEDNASQQENPQPIQQPQSQDEAMPVSDEQSDMVSLDEKELLSSLPTVESASEETPSNIFEDNEDQKGENKADEEETLDLDNDVFNLSPSMIVEEPDSDIVLENTSSDQEPEISEDDILNLSNLISASQEKDEQEDFLNKEETSEKNETPVLHAPLASEVLSEDESELNFSIDDALSGNEADNNLDDLINKEDISVSIEDDTAPILETEKSFAQDEDKKLEDIRAAIPPLDFDLPQVDVDSDPIFETDGHIVTDIDANQLKEGISNIEQEVLSSPQSSIEEFATEVEEKETHLEHSELKEEHLNGITQEEQERLAEEEKDNLEEKVIYSEPQDVSEENSPSQDAADVSANIINNFAKLFAEKKATQIETVAEPEAMKPTVEPIKNSSQSIAELVREAVVKQVTQQMDVNFETYAKEAVAAQTQAWLDANLPAIVEAVVAKEIERVMAKVGS